MQNNNVNWKLVIALLIAGFLMGCYVQKLRHPRESGDLITMSATQRTGYPITVLDTLRIPSIQYKIIPGSNYNIDSLVNAINQFWKDSLKNMYGKGLFQSKYSKTDDLGIRNYTYTSRIPPDPASTLTIDESFTLPKRTLGIIAGVNTCLVGSVGLKYYMIDSKHLSLSGIFSGDYLIDKKSWTPNAHLEIELRF